MVRVCLGEPHVAFQAQPKMMVPPDRSDQRGPLNSVIAEIINRGGIVEHPEYIVYKETQALPEYKIWYTHEQSCRCTHCWRADKVL